MNRSTLTMWVYGVYAIFAGAGFYLFPEFNLELFGFNEVNNYTWVRMFAVLVIGIGYYYLQMARVEAFDFYRVSVHGRLWAFTAGSLLVLFGDTKPILIIFLLIDALSAIWTYFALRSEATTQK